MKIFEPKDLSVKNIIRNIDDSIIQKLMQKCLKITKDDEYSKIYSDFYKTKYPIKDLSSKEQNLEKHLNKLITNYPSHIRTKIQGKEYCWILIDENNIESTAFRYYFAPNPSNMHEIIQKLTDQFIIKKIPVKFKYQLKEKMNECDRIILYSDTKHQKDIENVIQSVYQHSPNLFNDSERALPWVYTSDTPYVYLAPETPGSSYGEEFARTMIEAKEIFCYLYGITEKNNKIKLTGDDGTQALNYMELIITSLMLRKGLILSKDGKRIVFKDNIKSTYNYKTGELTNLCDDEYGHHRITYQQNIEGKNVLLNHFYGISKIQPQPGIKVEHLTQQERKRFLYEKFGWYADEFRNNKSKPSL